MVHVPNLAAHLAPNTVRQLEQAAKKRFEEGECLKRDNRLLGAVYLYGYSVEMCLAAAYFRRAGFGLCQPIDDDVRRLRMAKARQQRHRDGNPLMNSDPHPLEGWARFLEWQRQSSGNLTVSDEKRLREAVSKAKQVYKHWRPELRYRLTNVLIDQVDEVRLCVRWFIEQSGRL